MNRLVAVAFVLGLLGTTANAYPVAPDPAPARMMIRIAGGCGWGFHRGPYGGCRPNGAGAVVVVPGAIVVAPGVGPCGGRGRHEVCYPGGGCTMVCN
jgi:hypothetical protein